MPVAAVVGTVISIVNQAEVIIVGDTTGMTWVRIAVNYVVPYLVALVADWSFRGDPQASPSGS
ncbi:MAG: nitrate/nitrite transporter NrtS [Actinomycetota bacterium]|nr:nitrate/nitrite transporter NrtS [Actinomycetota bacterium]